MCLCINMAFISTLYINRITSDSKPFIFTFLRQYFDFLYIVINFLILLFKYSEIHFNCIRDFISKASICYYKGINTPHISKC